MASVFGPVMSTHVSLTVALLCLRLGLSPAAPNPTVQAGALSGRVVAALDGSPIAGAQVTASLLWSRVGEPDSSFVAVTDIGGQFEIAPAVQGSFRIRVQKPGYLTTEYGAGSYGAPGTPIALEKGARSPDLAIQLEKSGVVTGTIRTPDGAPAPGVRVALDPRGGSPDVTDASGTFRLADVPPGDYRVMAQTPVSMRLVRVPVLEVINMDQVMNALRARDTLAVSVVTEHRESWFAERSYYPGTANAESAQKLTIAAGEVHSGIDFAIVMTGKCRLAGSVVGPQGEPVAGAGVSASSAAPNGPRVASATTGNDGRFVLDGIVGAGAYDVSASVRILAQPSTDRGVSNVRFWALEKVFMTCGDSDSVLLRMRPAISVSGRVVVDAMSAADQLPSLTAVRVSMRDTSSESFGTATTEADGRFEVQGLAGSRYQLRVSGLPPGWVPKSAMWRNQDLIDEPIDLTSNPLVRDVVVTVTNRRTGLAGTLTTPDGVPAVAYVIAVLPQDPALWNVRGSRRFALARPASNGHFVVPDLPAGEYVVGAIGGAAAGRWQTPAVLRELAQVGSRITLKDGEVRRLDLRIR